VYCRRRACATRCEAAGRRPLPQSSYKIVMVLFRMYEKAPATTVATGEKPGCPRQEIRRALRDAIHGPFSTLPYFEFTALFWSLPTERH
jgi:hypothetical protein